MNDAFEIAAAMLRARMAASLPVIAALEGGAATGKTTLAAALSREFGAPVIAMDDFFLPPSLRTPERLGEPGGNIDYARFEREVAGPLQRGEAFSYRVYDCHAGDFAGEKRVAPGPLTLVEGVYSLHPRYRGLYTLRFFLRAAPEIQDARLRARGEGLYARFQALWLPLEQAYFDATRPDKTCDAILDT